MNKSLFLASLLSVLLCSCTVGKEALDLARTAATFTSTADPFLRDAYEAEQRACFSLPIKEQDPCFLSVRSKWKEIIKGLTDIRAAWCKFEPAKCPGEVK